MRRLRLPHVKLSLKLLRSRRRGGGGKKAREVGSKKFDSYLQRPHAVHTCIYHALLIVILHNSELRGNGVLNAEQITKLAAY